MFALCSALSAHPVIDLTGPDPVTIIIIDSDDEAPPVQTVEATTPNTVEHAAAASQDVAAAALCILSAQTRTDLPEDEATVAYPARETRSEAPTILYGPANGHSKLKPRVHQAKKSRITGKKSSHAYKTFRRNFTPDEVSGDTAKEKNISGC